MLDTESLVKNAPQHTTHARTHARTHAHTRISGQCRKPDREGLLQSCTAEYLMKSAQYKMFNIKYPMESARYKMFIAEYLIVFDAYTVCLLQNTR